MKTGKPFLIAGIPIAGLALQSHGSVSAWTPPHAHPTSSSSLVRHSSHNRRTSSTILSSSTDIDISTLNLTPELEMMTNAFSSIPDEKTRHKQLLYMASKLPNVDDSIRVPENKVPGCLSTVHVDCILESKADDGDEQLVVNYVGDSDGLLTKGLLALLIRGLSGCTVEEINAVDPQFIQAAKISQTLTPGRNNGFLNMLAVMKKKASDAVEHGEEEKEVTNGSVASVETANDINGGMIEEIEGKPMYNAILSKLTTVLKPTSIKLIDNSSQHAGHAGSKGWEESGESHFALEVVAEAFDGLNLVKRHQLIYMLLGDVMQKIHALEISAKSPDEVE